MNILGVNISEISKEQATERLAEFLIDGRQHLIFTPNPEMLVEAEHDWFFKQALNQADLAMADGFGLVLAAKYLYHQPLSRLTGMDLLEEICKVAIAEHRSVFLLGGERGVAEKAAEKLTIRHPDLRIVGAEHGIKLTCAGCQNKGALRETKYLVGMDMDAEDNQLLLERLRAAKPDILLVAFGHGKQEKWLAEYLPQLPSVKIGMGVGGAFDFLAGRVSRAPRWLRQLGLEWLWRWSRQPIYRTHRIWRAVITFSFLARDFKKQIVLPYRQGVIGYIQNKEGKFFLAKRHPKVLDYYFMHMDHWQPPQGGIDQGETPEQAIIREVREETGMEVEIICAGASTARYDWSVEFMRKKGRGYHFRGQNKRVFLLRYNGDGGDIRLDNTELDEYRWLDLADLKKMLHPFRRNSLEILESECLVCRGRPQCLPTGEKADCLEAEKMLK